MNKIAKMKTALFLLLGMGAMQSCEKDVLLGQPEWLGNSIYERLQDGITTTDGNTRSFTNTLRLIDDLGETQTLSLSGSKTLFVCPDDVYESVYGADPQWYEHLSQSQKKEMLYGAMINNAYLLDLMSNVKGENGSLPREGLAMRRPTSASINDSITTYKLSDMPVNPLGNTDFDVWKTLRERGKDLHMYRDETTKTMMHFLEPFMVYNDITNEDLQIMTNGVSSSIKDAWINGKKVISTTESGTCKNGYVYVVDGIATPSDNMAEVISNAPEMSIWASFLKRFSCPVPMKGSILSEYRRLMNTNDSIFALHYLNYSSENPLRKNDYILENINDKGLLNFDPGWNHYHVGSNTLYFDGAAMLVPSNDVVNEWWMNGAGKPLREEYGTMDNIPYETLASLMRVNMRQSLIESVPSKFADMLDDAQGNLGARKEHILKSYMANNGMVYLVSQLYTPAEFRSVMYPATSHSNTSFSAIYHSITGTASGQADSHYDFSSYLTDLESQYSFLLPQNIRTPHDQTNVKYDVYRYIDPCSYGLDQQNVMEIYYAKNKIEVSYYKCTIDANGEITWQTSPVRRGTLSVNKFQNMLYDLTDNSIIISDIKSAAPGQKYFKTKAGSYIYAEPTTGGYKFRGGFQENYNQDITVSNDYIYSGYGNDKKSSTFAFQTDATMDEKVIGIPMTSDKSVCQTLKAAVANSVDCNLFYTLLTGDPSDDGKNLVSSENGTGSSAYKCFAHGNGNVNITAFDSYNYTVFVPNDASIQKLIDDKFLPTWTDWDTYNTEYEAKKDDPNPAVKAEAEKAKKIRDNIADCIRSFLRYHIMDNSVYIAGDPLTNTLYETAKLNTTTQRFYPVTIVKADANDLVVKDVQGNVRNVQTDFRNKSCRESWVKNQASGTDQTEASTSATVESTSFAVVHKIDGVLLFRSFTPGVDEEYWKNVTSSN